MKRLWRAMKKSVPVSFRLYLGFIFLIYGLAKIIMGQFAAVEPTSQIAGLHPDPKGFALAWTFFAYSRVYEIFIGVGEVMAAILIMIPRTATLGAVAYFPISVNVLMVNVCFGIGVADLSTVLVVMNLFLLWADRRKLLMIFWDSSRIEHRIPETDLRGEKTA
ncbi:hypothetical protein [Lihuaxuella thermophila]|uniref:DoxX protein n=1 Tax=Lihuaxuella thermophila TaxID=1173111 RepID=A0A1H8IGQ6_9BACL|nr:hypothetical protein [Lihuaxuella thermophila]SEN67416.1 hypothetical protein SAMN05444955_11769 [Lihuaxuella thermophila]